MGFYRNRPINTDKNKALYRDLKIVNLIQIFSRLIAPRIDKNLLRKVLMLLTIFSDRDTGREMINLLKRL